MWAFVGVKGVLRGLLIGQDDAQVTSCEVSWTRKLDNSHASSSMEGCKSRHKLVSQSLFCEKLTHCEERIIHSPGKCLAISM